MIATQGVRAAVIGVTAAAALLAGSVGEASHANATCVGISGINIGSGCQSGIGSIAIGIGAGAQAKALGALNFAVALGNESTAYAYDGLANLAVALGTGAYASGDRIGNLAVAVGEDAAASAGGVANLAVAFGGPGENAEWGYHRTEALIQGTLNVAVGLFGGSSANATGLPNLAVALGGGYANAGGLQIKVAFPGQVKGASAAPAKRPSKQVRGSSASAQSVKTGSTGHAAPRGGREP